MHLYQKGRLARRLRLAFRSLTIAEVNARRDARYRRITAGEGGPDRDTWTGWGLPAHCSTGENGGPGRCGGRSRRG
jgi:hypothetical protein